MTVGSTHVRRDQAALLTSYLCENKLEAEVGINGPKSWRDGVGIGMGEGRNTAPGD